MKRIIHTLLSHKPNSKAKLSLGFCIFIIVLASHIKWNFDPRSHFFQSVSQQSIYENQEYWRLFTATLVHGDYGHLFSNLYMFTILGFYCFAYYGTIKIPLISFLGAGLVNLITVNFYPPQVQLLGASGWVYLLAGFWFSLYMLVDRRHSFSRRLLRVLGIAVVTLFPSTFQPQVSYLAHFLGFLLGLGGGLLYFVTHKAAIRDFERHHTDEEDEAEIDFSRSEL